MTKIDFEQQIFMTDSTVKIKDKLYPIELVDLVECAVYVRIDNDLEIFGCEEISNVY